MKQSNDSSIISINTYLHNLENELNIYVVKEFYYSINSKGDPINEKLKETFFDTGDNKERLIKAERFFTIKHQNITYAKSLGNIKFFKLSLCCLENKNGIREEIILKLID